MYSANLSKKDATNQKIIEEQHKKATSVANKNLKVRNICASQSQVRTNQWTVSNSNSKAAELLQKGCSSLDHPDLHNFRDYKAKGSIYLRR